MEKRKISESLKKLPNRITMFRMFIIVLFIPSLLASNIVFNYISLFLFAIAAISDWLDGFLARKYEIVSDFGKVMDPLADKILVISTMLCFVQLNLVPAWMVVIIISREFLINGIRIMAAQGGKIIMASNWGKAKTVVEMTAITTVLFLKVVQDTIEYFNERQTWEEILMRLGNTGDILVQFVYYAPYWLMFAAATVSLISGLDYFFKNKRMFDEGI
jgi:CDP-diacylglycerol--glycerol-3-phosphate 3-phosphatidyltransferase